MDLGRYRQGEPIMLTVLCTDGDDVAFEPGAPPVVKVYNDAAVQQLLGSMALLDRYRQPGWCGYRWRLAGQGVGHYSVSFQYLAGLATFTKTAVFEVVKGGHPDGAVLAMHHYERPHAAFLVHQTESGTRVFGRNPSV